MEFKVVFQLVLLRKINQAEDLSILKTTTLIR
jgi:hypothetical protein